jgi:hypothetical protein
LDLQLDRFGKQLLLVKQLPIAQNEVQMVAFIPNFP